MNKGMGILKNKWFIFGVSFLNAAYSAALCFFAYAVFFYDIEYTNKVTFAVFYSVFSLLIGFLMYYTRKSRLTAVFGMLNMVLFLPTLLLDWGNWPLLIPAAIVTLFGFFSCRMNDTFKTVMGTVFLLMYIVAGVAFFLVMNVFRIQTVDTLIGQGVSPSGDFRYYIVDMQNNASGKTVVYVQPNTLDIDHGFVKMDCTIKRLIRQVNNPAVIECRWEDTRLFINNEEYFDETEFITFEDGERVYDFSNGTWTYTFFSLDYPLFELINSMTETIREKLSEPVESETEQTVTDVPAARVMLSYLY